jgi:hypothetical protein
MDEDAKLTQARQRVARLKEFYVHLSIYVAVMTLLFFIDLVTGDGWWFHWPLMGWGVGVAMHALGVFGLDRVFGAEWEKKKVDELMKR